MEKLIYQMFILGCQNPENALKKGLGGVILFTADINDEQSLKRNIQEYKKNALISPFISIDQEGGRVERTESIHPKRLSAKYAFQRGGNFLQCQAEEISKELAEWGFNLNFAPCVDVNTNPLNPIIGERSFSNNPEDVIKGAEIFVNESRKYSVIPCIKHFPGHGDADKDSHLSLPQIELSLAEMENVHIKPFRELIKQNIEMIMVAHLHCTCFNKEVIPSSLSKNAVKYLRNILHYDGIVITDDMVMKGVEKYGSLEACIMGINAGVDMFIFRNSDEKTLTLIEDLIKVVEKDDNLKEKVLKSNERILALKQRYGII